jgi:hypothetical protein
VECCVFICSGARWQSSRPLSRNIAVLKVGGPWKIGVCESGREPCSQTPTYDIPATAGEQAITGMLASAKIPAATGLPAFSKGHQQEKPQPQQQDLFGKAIIKMAGNGSRNMAVNVAVI